MKQALLFKGLFFLVLFTYPLIVYFGIQTVPPSLIGVLLLILLAMRFGVLRPEERKIQIPFLLVLVAYATLATIMRSEKFLLYYPVVVNLVLCAVFLLSLRGSESILLRLVRARGIKMSVYGPAYLNRLTIVWALFFILNATVAGWTTTQSMEVWTLYNGLIAYILVGVMVGAEWLFRIHYKKRKGVYHV